MFEQDVKVQVYRVENYVSFFFTVFILYFFGLYFLCFFYLFFGCLLVLEEEEEPEGNEKEVEDFIPDYIELGEFESLKYRKDERDGLEIVLEDLLALLEAEVIEDPEGYISNEEQLSQFQLNYKINVNRYKKVSKYKKGLSFTLLRLRRHRLRRRLSVLQSLNEKAQEQEQDEKIVKQKNVAKC